MELENYIICENCGKFKVVNGEEEQHIDLDLNSFKRLLYKKKAAVNSSFLVQFSNEYLKDINNDIKNLIKNYNLENRKLTENKLHVIFMSIQQEMIDKEDFKLFDRLVNKSNVTILYALFLLRRLYLVVKNEQVLVDDFEKLFTSFKIQDINKYIAEKIFIKQPQPPKTS